ncbi:MAG: hypothetical protein QNJ70_02915 [Xenococcaceae cyanobacterium MO_207.B15]|nr:hypothetical protein [Xenococcaceae cyanobacterium MO_207.B15]
MIPFFVADRPMSLRILKGLNLKDYPGVKIGIMAHANTSDNFQRAFRDYPCEDLKRCDAIGGKPCLYKDKSDTERYECAHRKLIVKRTVKMCDSGVFTKEGAMLSYEELFAAYDRMNVDYGIMIDVLHDAPATIESAKEAKKAYKPYQDKFKLVVVAQGKTEEEYLDCYSKLQHQGFENIAIGGLLVRNQNTVRYVKVGSNELLFNILERVKEDYSPDWLFALGCLNPNRVEHLNKLNVWADYKGWIFKYKKRNDSIDLVLNDLTQYLETINDLDVHHALIKINDIILNRKQYRENKDKLSQKLYQEKLKLRNQIQNIIKELQDNNCELPNAIMKLSSRGILSSIEEERLVLLLNQLSKPQNYIKEITEHINENRYLNQEIKNLELSINTINKKLCAKIKQLNIKTINLTSEVQKCFKELIRLINISEQDHRLKQVRSKIEQNILKLLIH